MSEEFGPRLRRERERRKISLDSISASTKVSVSLFQALERDDLSRWPSGIFRRSFVRSYAAAIGLDPEEVVQEFVERFADPHEPAQPPAATGGVLSIREPRRAALRLTLAETGRPFSGGRLVRSYGRRLAAATVDGVAALAVGAILFLILDAFWMPTALFLAAYYFCGILVLGNTPGVCLLAPASHGDESDALESASRRRFSLAALWSRRDEDAEAVGAGL
jgi:hypothetical protein